jgi:hypothetical protein
MFIAEELAHPLSQQRVVVGDQDLQLHRLAQLAGICLQDTIRVSFRLLPHNAVDIRLRWSAYLGFLNSLRSSPEIVVCHYWEASKTQSQKLNVYSPLFLRIGNRQ